MRVDTVKLLMAGAGLDDAARIVAERLGFFEDEGLAVEATLPGSMKIADMLGADPSAIALGGAWRPAMYRGRGVDLSLFGTYCLGPPHQLFGREPGPDFAWTALESAVLVLPAGQPSGDMVLWRILKSEGIEVGSARVVHGLHPAEAERMFAAGMGDYILVTPPVPEAITAAGAASVATLAPAAGRLPWGVYYGSSKSLGQSDAPVRFSRAVQRGLHWVRDAEPAAIWELCADRFADASDEAALAGIAYFLERELWPASTRVPEDPLMSWQATMRDYGLIDATIPFASLVDARVADAASAAEEAA